MLNQECSFVIPLIGLWSELDGTSVIASLTIAGSY